ncbi:hypothetical protein B0T25DRAFT_554566 [Lasiosphaeria hispida]|uniref:Uncharacterized protein n=1 Tax=Lasiosphaeria hispida TaxID=260671 RepID=A0AAJ0M962_9PEZI|nr:hypothetical protein B0T25DRAFT_554566 [Lasiosphaeria hispida]
MQYARPTAFFGWLIVCARSDAAQPSELTVTLKRHAHFETALVCHATHLSCSIQCRSVQSPTVASIHLSNRHKLLR